MRVIANNWLRQLKPDSAVQECTGCMNWGAENSEGVENDKFCSLLHLLVSCYMSL